MPVPTATAALVAALSQLGGEHRVTRLVSSLLTGDEPPLVVAVVGPSGVGKSTLVNLLAEAEVADASVLRPTTLEAKEWLSPDGDLRLIDGPPSDQMPDAGLAPIDDADVALVVTSQARYADAATWTCVRRTREAGIPIVIAVNRLDRAVAGLIAEEVAERAGEERVLAILEGGDGDLAALRSVLDAAVADLPAIRSLRRHRVCGPAAAAVRGLALELRIESERVAVLSDALSDAAAAAVPIDDLAQTAEGIADDLTDAACAAIERTSGVVLAALTDVWERLGLRPPRRDRLSAMGFDDVAAIEDWRLGTAEAFAAIVRPRWLLRLAGARIADESWRLSVDAGRRLRGWARIGLGARAEALRAGRGGALAVTLTDRLHARMDLFARAVPATVPADPDRLEALAGKLGDEHPPAPTPGYLIGAGV